MVFRKRSESIILDGSDSSDDSDSIISDHSTSSSAPSSTDVPAPAVPVADADRWAKYREPTKPSGWTENNLTAFKIEQKLIKTADDFWGRHLESALQASIPTIYFDIEGNENLPNDVSPEVRRYFQYEANLDVVNAEWGSNALVAEMMRILSFDEPGYMIAAEAPFYWMMKNKRMQGKPDVSLLDLKNRFVVIVVKDKPDGGAHMAMAQAVAYACGAFQFNNELRIDKLGELPVESATMVFASFNGWKPTFYKMKVTSELASAIKEGREPTETTYVERFVQKWVVGSGDWRKNTPRTALRRKVFEHMVAFRELAKECRGCWYEEENAEK